MAYNDLNDSKEALPNETAAKYEPALVTEDAADLHYPTRPYCQMISYYPFRRQFGRCHRYHRHFHHFRQ
jgi:hypothetical protein